MGIDLPVGLAMKLARSDEGTKNFAALSDDDQAAIVSYIQQSVTGADAKKRIGDAFTGIEHGDLSFLS